MVGQIFDIEVLLISWSTIHMEQFFFKSVDASNASSFVNDAQLLFEMLDEVVEEVGDALIVQVVTDNASAYKAGRMLMEKRPHLYWTPCAAHCIDLMLERLGQLPQHKSAILKGKFVSKFIYNHSWVLSLMRKFTDKEIIKSAVTRFATAYLIMQRFKELRQPLEAMFASEKWDKSSCIWST
ncbi:hypothetical protein MA16_Dca007160 [Dendrobium catenatum]|uniref:DUF659 domain-containing protein n=1 Tax=Dendrobium catenatum TaxID=906689 RepID=A0A2I0W441_9ASPA|nr:hypothetical protein MA16_Dca007160 [Dendrobium catenatum]